MLIKSTAFPNKIYSLEKIFKQIGTKSWSALPLNPLEKNERKRMDHQVMVEWFWQFRRNVIRPGSCPRVLRWGDSQPTKADVPHSTSDSMDQTGALIPCSVRSSIDHQMFHDLINQSIHLTYGMIDLNRILRSKKWIIDYWNGRTLVEQSKRTIQ